MSQTLHNTLRWHSYFIWNGLTMGAVAGTIYALVEGYVDGPPFTFDFIALSRGLMIGSFIGSSIGFFEVVSYYAQRKLAVWLLILFKTAFYVLIINIWLIAINAFYIYINGTIYAFGEYLENSYLPNLLFSFVVAIFMVTAIQVSKLHRKNELFYFLFGKYHKPGRENIMILFADLKGSTTLAESMGDVKYANFLKDYYADISEPIFECKGGVYQYVGDEIVIYWQTGTPEKNQRSVLCQELIRSKITERESYYQKNYGSVPQFRASLHSGSVVMTWVGEMKRELLFIGDVLNTCSRMQEICKRIGKDFLISGQALDVLPMTGEYLYPFEEKLIPRGKQKEILVFSVEQGEVSG
jgi:adenylate cyclase